MADPQSHPGIVALLMMADRTRVGVTLGHVEDVFGGHFAAIHPFREGEY
jgi:hypothetical protein